MPSSGHFDEIEIRQIKLKSNRDIGSRVEDLILKTILYLTTVAVLGIPGPNTGFTRFTRSANTISCRGVIGLGI